MPPTVVVVGAVTVMLAVAVTVPAVADTTPLPKPVPAVKSPLGVIVPRDGGVTDHMTPHRLGWSNWAITTGGNRGAPPATTLAEAGAKATAAGVGAEPTVRFNPSYTSA